MLSSEEMEPTMFSSMREAAKAVGMGERVIRYVRNNGRDFVRDLRAKAPKVFLIKLCCK